MASYIVTLAGQSGGVSIDFEGTVDVENAAGVAPVLTNPIDTKTGSTTANIGVTTDRANGTLYAVVTTSATPPSAAQVKLGQMHTGAAAAFADDQVITTAGAKTFSATGLTAATAYFAHFMHEDAGTNQSTVATAGGFATDPVGSVSYAPAGATSNGASNFSSKTMVNREYRIDNNVTVNSIGLYLTIGRPVTMKIVHRDSAGQYDVVVSESFAHPGSGWADHTIASPYVVAASGDYYPAAHVSTSAALERCTATLRADKAGNVTGNNQTGFAESATASAFCLRVTGTIPA